MKTFTVVLIVLIVAVAGIAAWKYGVFGNNNATSSTPSREELAAHPDNAVTTITYTSSGFYPKTVTIKKGEIVEWVNNTSGQMWVASAVHPSHSVYSGTTLSQHCPDTANVSFDECSGSGPRGTWSFIFEKTGTWSYHDHLNASNGGSVIVQ